jgi:hypothetical protein
MSCVRKGGLCILEHSSEHSPCGASELDPFGADITLMPYLITTWGGGRYGVRELIEAPKKIDSVKYLSFIVIQRFEIDPKRSVPDAATAPERKAP